MDRSIPSQSLSAWRVVLFAGLAGLAVCSLSVALDSAPASATEGDLGTPSLVVDLPAPVAEAVGAAQDLSADVPSGLVADIPVVPDIPVPDIPVPAAPIPAAPIPTAGETVAAVGSAVDAIAVASDAVAPIVSDVTDHVVVPPLPGIDLPALPVPALPVPALPVVELPVTASSVELALPGAAPSVPLAATLSAGSNVDQSSSERAAASPGTPAAFVALASAPRGSSDDVPRNPASPSDAPAQPRTSSAPSGTSNQVTADLAGEHPAITSQRAILPSSRAAACHPAPSFDPGSTPD